MTDPIYQGFLGDWILDVDNCEFEQGDPPRSASNSITEDGQELIVAMDWTDTDGETHHMSFRAVPDGRKIPFNGGPLADHLSVTAINDSELVAAAYRDGIELMTAIRTLSPDGSVMELEQVVHLPDGASPRNSSFYYRRH